MSLSPIQGNYLLVSDYLWSHYDNLLTLHIVSGPEQQYKGLKKKIMSLDSDGISSTGRTDKISHTPTPEKTRMSSL